VRRLFALLLCSAALVAAGALAGCGSDGGEQASPASSDATATPTPKKDGGGGGYGY